MQDGNPDRRKTTGHLGTHSTVEIETFRAGLGGLGAAWALWRGTTSAL